METTPTAHLDADTLAAYVDGRLASSELGDADRHIDGCRSCRLELSTLAATSSQPRVSLGDAPEGTLGRYHILRELGRGSMGIVLRAYDPELGRPGALKLVRDVDAMMRELLRREARALAKLRHPNVVTVYDVIIESDAICVAMELVEGDTLRGYCTGKTTREILDACVRAGRGLAAAHDAGVVHRDFKPENVLCGGDGEVKVSDFGLARVAEEEADGALCGTPGYMAPEVLDRKPATAASDQYSFCISVFELLTGERPTRGAPKSSAAFPALPTWVLRVLRRGLELDPAARYPSMQALVNALADDPRGRRRRALALVAGAAVAVATGALVVKLSSNEGPSCAIDQRALGDKWTPALKRKLEAHLTRISDKATADRVVAAFDQYAMRWVEARRETCVAARGGTNDVIERRFVCLDTRLHVMSALGRAFLTATEGRVGGAQDAVGRLPDPASCASNASPLPADVTSRVFMGQVLGFIAEAEAQLYAGNNKLAEALATQAVDILERNPTVSPKKLAEATFVLAQSAIDLGQPERAEELYFKALKAAEIAHDDVLAATLWVEIVAVTGVQRQRFDLATSNARAADAAFARIDPGADLRLRYAYTFGSILLMNGQLSEARKRFEAVLTVGTAHSSGIGQLGQIQVALCDIERQAGDTAKALKLCNDGLRNLETLVGPENVRLAVSLNTLGAVQFGARDLAGAEATYRRAIAIFEKRSSHNFAYGLALANLGAVYMHRGELAASRELYTKSLAFFDLRHPKHPQRMASLRGLANIAMRSGDAAGAIPLYVKIREALGEMYPPEHSERLSADYNLALAYQLDRKLDEAAVILAEMTWNALQPGKELWMLAGHGFDLAGSVAAQQNNHAQAIVLRERAVAAFSHLPPSIEIANVRRKLGVSYIYQKKPAKAREVLDAAVAGYIEHKAGAYDLGVARFALAQALLESNDDGDRAVELLRLATDDFAQAKSGDRLEGYRARLAKYLAEVEQSRKKRKR